MFFHLHHYSYTWQIPFTYTTKTGADFNVSREDVQWLEDKEQGNRYFKYCGVVRLSSAENYISTYEIKSLTVTCDAFLRSNNTFS